MSAERVDNAPCSSCFELDENDQNPDGTGQRRLLLTAHTFQLPISSRAKILESVTRPCCHVEAGQCPRLANLGDRQHQFESGPERRGAKARSRRHDRLTV